MLELRLSYEHCNVSLLPCATQTLICNFACTFWRACVEEMLGNVCPNCGDSFSAGPVRPSTHWKNENYLDEHSAGGTVTHRLVDEGTDLGGSRKASKTFRRATATEEDALLMLGLSAWT